MALESSSIAAAGTRDSAIASVFYKPISRPSDEVRLELLEWEFGFMPLVLTPPVELLATSKYFNKEHW